MFDDLEEPTGKVNKTDDPEESPLQDRKTDA